MRRAGSGGVLKPWSNPPLLTWQCAPAVRLERGRHSPLSLILSNPSPLFSLPGARHTAASLLALLNTATYPPLSLAPPHRYPSTAGRCGHHTSAITHRPAYSRLDKECHISNAASELDGGIGWGVRGTGGRRWRQGPGKGVRWGGAGARALPAQCRPCRQQAGPSSSEQGSMTNQGA